MFVFNLRRGGAQIQAYLPAPYPLFLPSCSPRDFRSLRSARRPSRFQESSDSDGGGGGGRTGVRDDAPELYSPAFALEPKATPHPAPSSHPEIPFSSVQFGFVPCPASSGQLVAGEGAQIRSDQSLSRVGLFATP